MILLIFIILLIILLIILISCYKVDNFTQVKDPEKNTIFVSIASYRDPECSMTIDSLYSNARYPENIYLGICEQNDKNNKKERCYSKMAEKYKNNIRYKTLDYTEAKGPTYARYWCSKLYKNEDFYFQIDSHTLFEKDWDFNLIKMYNQCLKTTSPETDTEWGINGSSKPVLSSYPPASDQMSLVGFPIMDQFKLAPNGIPIFMASFSDSDNMKPIKSPKPFCAAGFMFLRGSFLKEIPFDPTLEYIFQGEELLFSLRLFTHGYDIYNPNIKVCSHHYNRKGSLYWKDIKNQDSIREENEKKIIKLLNEELSNYKYGFGSKRSIKEFKKYLEFKN